MTKLIAGIAFATLLGAMPAVAAQPGKPDAAKPMMMVDTPSFVKMVPSSNAFEIRSSEMAQKKASSADVKEFAAQMIKDHTKAGEELAKAEGKDMAPMPTDAELAPKHAAMLKLLDGASGAEFEQLYIDMQAGAHMEAVSLFRTYAGSGDDPKVVAFAKKTLPTLEMHEMHVKKLVASH